MLAGCANALDKFHGTQTSFASEATGPPSPIAQLFDFNEEISSFRPVPVPLFEKLSEKLVPRSCRSGSGIRFGSSRFSRTPDDLELPDLREFFPVASSSKCVDSPNQFGRNHPAYRISGYAAPAGCLAHQSLPLLRPPAPRDGLPTVGRAPELLSLRDSRLFLDHRLLFHNP